MQSARGVAVAAAPIATATALIGAEVLARVGAGIIPAGRAGIAAPVTAAAGRAGIAAPVAAPAGPAGIAAPIAAAAGIAAVIIVDDALTQTRRHSAAHQAAGVMVAEQGRDPLEQQRAACDTRRRRRRRAQEPAAGATHAATHEPATHRLLAVAGLRIAGLSVRLRRRGCRDLR